MEYNEFVYLGGLWIAGEDLTGDGFPAIKIKRVAFKWENKNGRESKCRI